MTAYTAQETYARPLGKACLAAMSMCRPTTGHLCGVTGCDHPTYIGPDRRHFVCCPCCHAADKETSRRLQKEHARGLRRQRARARQIRLRSVYKRMAISERGPVCRRCRKSFAPDDLKLYRILPPAFNVNDIDDYAHFQLLCDACVGPQAEEAKSLRRRSVAASAAVNGSV